MAPKYLGYDDLKEGMEVLMEGTSGILRVKSINKKEKTVTLESISTKRTTTHPADQLEFLKLTKY